MARTSDQKGSNWRRFISASFFILLLLFLSSVLLAKTDRISVMTYNVENLFDATDDGAFQGDPTFLPMKIKKRWRENKCLRKFGFRRYLCESLDWTQEKYEKRLRKITKVLLSYNKVGADIIVLEELENRRVILDLWSRHLRRKGYRFPIHFESPSNRGIDVGIISRFPLAGEAMAHPVDLTGIDPNPTRDIIEATFLIDGYRLFRVAANHWPSLAHVVDTRRKAATVIKKIALRSRRQKVPFVATGDFNTLPTESPNPIDNYLADNSLRRRSRPMVDLGDYLGGYPNFFRDGSHFYKGEWSPLDRMLVSKLLFRRKGGMKVNLSSFGVHAPQYLLKTDYLTDPETGEERLYTFPHRYDFLSDEGYSDHLPVVLKIDLR